MKKTLAAAALLVLTACAAPTQGEVLDRRYDDPDRVSSQSCTGSGSNRHCTTSYRTDPAEWELKLRHGDEEGWRDVGEQAYNACQTGEQYPECADPGRS